MSNIARKAAGALALPLIVSGCAVFHPQSGTARLQERKPPVELVYNGSFEFEFGRAALLDERYGQAIASFRKSEIYPDFQAESNNGLGIAYAALGRNDIALHYFGKAVEFAPDEAKYRANLARLKATQAVAVARSPAMDQPMAIRPGATARPAIVQLSVRADGSTQMIAVPVNETGLVRMSAREVQLVDRPRSGRTDARALALADGRKASGR